MKKVILNPWNHGVEMIGDFYQNKLFVQKLLDLPIEIGVNGNNLMAFSHSYDEKQMVLRILYDKETIDDVSISAGELSFTFYKVIHSIDDKD
jgi:hypothetical protein